MLTDANGIPVGLAVDGANRNDHLLVGETLSQCPARRPMPTRKEPQNLCLDKGYDYDEARWVIAGFRFTPHIRCRGEEVRALRRGHRARRWVVERTHSWMNRFRRILVRWEKRADTYTAMLHLACGLIAWRRAGLLG